MWVCEGMVGPASVTLIRIKRQLTGNDGWMEYDNFVLFLTLNAS